MGKTEGFKVRAAVILPYEDKILLVRQNGRDFWVFPGGTLEPGEGLAECAIRELQEEVNLTVRIEKLLYVANFITPERQVVDTFFLGQLESGELKRTEEENIDEVGFFTLEAFSRLRVMPDIVAHQVQQDMAKGFQHTTGLYLGKYGSTTPP